MILYAGEQRGLELVRQLENLSLICQEYNEKVAAAWKQISSDLKPVSESLAYLQLYQGTQSTELLRMSFNRQEIDIEERTSNDITYRQIVSVLDKKKKTPGTFISLLSTPQMEEVSVEMQKMREELWLYVNAVLKFRAAERKLNQIKTELQNYENKILPMLAIKSRIKSRETREKGNRYRLLKALKY